LLRAERGCAIETTGAVTKQNGGAAGRPSDCSNTVEVTIHVDGDRMLLRW
jgi:hypothetical protein